MNISQASQGRGHHGLLIDIAMLAQREGTGRFSNRNPERGWGRGSFRGHGWIGRAVPLKLSVKGTYKKLVLKVRS